MAIRWNLVKEALLFTELCARPRKRINTPDTIELEAPPALSTPRSGALEPNRARGERPVHAIENSRHKPVLTFSNIG